MTIKNVSPIWRSLELSQVVVTDISQNFGGCL
jgi:hypothetical protein